MSCIISSSQITILTVGEFTMSRRVLRILVSLPLLQSLTFRYIECQESDEGDGDPGDEANDVVSLDSI